MILQQRIDAFVQLGLFINRHFENNYKENETQLHQGLEKLIETANIYNNWFIPQFVNTAIGNIGKMLDEKSLTDFCKDIESKDTSTSSASSKTVAVICAGNIPMVGFHDIMCVILSGHNVLIKLSSDDDILLPFFLKLLTHYEPELEKNILFAQAKLANFDAVIATGSNNTANYFNFYFGKYPNIIRKNRTSIAVLGGNESTENLKKLGDDIFLYFGLGCRNVSKLLVPKNYSFNLFFESIIDFGFVINNKKYGNNYDYHRAIYLLEQITFLDNNFLMIKQSEDLHSPVGVLYYDFYETENDIANYLSKNSEQLQCVIGKNHIPFGYSQQPVITDFADNVNTLKFLVNL
ncbi:MAG: acyl-CoA reductase [Bacteroidota bacterium]|nr:acyl-CoA reductase [Bacteroidota bacterium]